MNYNTIKKIHLAVTPFAIVPLFIIVITGIILMFKKESDWIQPPSQYGVGGIEVSLNSMLDTVKLRDSLGVKSWDDVERVDVRPSKGMAKVRLKSHWEVQIDTKTGAILQTAYRRSDIIEDIHTGAFWGKSVKFIVFLGSAILLLILLLTGTYMYVVLMVNRFKKRLSQK